MTRANTDRRRGAIVGLHEFAPQEEESEAPEVAENGQAPELELAEA